MTNGERWAQKHPQLAKVSGASRAKSLAQPTPPRRKRTVAASGTLSDALAALEIVKKNRKSVSKKRTDAKMKRAEPRVVPQSGLIEPQAEAFCRMHPRGATGITHSPATRALIGAASVESRRTRTPKQESERMRKCMETKLANGTYAIARGSWKAAWREIGGKRRFFRSRWEANYARWLQWRKESGEITEWEHEPETFWFEAIKRGCRSYLPDFKVTENDGSLTYHEVKGWMDARSATKIRRMKKYYPHVDLIVIDSGKYKAMTKNAKLVIVGWE